MTIIRKAAGTIEKAGEEERTARVVITTSDVDRVGDIVEPAGVDLTNYQKNPVVLLAHDHKVPVGTLKDITKEPHRITAKVAFHDETPEARQTWRLVKMGVLNGVSVGFKPAAQPEALPAGANGRPGWRYTKSELLEVSMTTVPANPNAVVLRSLVNSGRLDGQKLHPTIRKSLREALRSQPRAKKEKAVSQPALKKAIADGESALTALKKSPDDLGAIAKAEATIATLERVASQAKALAESSAPAGGAAVPPDAMAEQPKSDTEDMKATIEALVMNALKVGLANLAAKSDTPPPLADPLGGGAGDPFAEDDSDPFAEDDDPAEEEADGLGADDDPPFEGDEEEDDEEDEDALARYRQRSRKPPIRKAAPPMKLKSMKAHAACLKEAMDHLGAMGEMAPGSAWTGMHQSSCKYHHGKMTEMCKAIAEAEAGEDKPAEPAEAAPTEKELTPEAIKKAIAEALAEATLPAREALYRVTGRKVG